MRNRQSWLRDVSASVELVPGAVAGLSCRFTPRAMAILPNKAIAGRCLTVDPSFYTFGGQQDSWKLLLFGSLLTSRSKTDLCLKPSE